MKRCIKKTMKYAGCFAAAILVFVLLLAISACVPQQAVASHINASLPGLAAEGTYPTHKQGVSATRLDNYTDSLIIAETLATNSSDMSTIFSNPLFLYKGDPLESLLYYAENPDISPDGYYVRYWMGFRTTLRPLFSVFTYSQIRHISFGVLLLLTCLAALSVAKRVNPLAAAGLVLSILMMRPMIIGRSFQYSTCFLVALISLLCVPYLHRKKRDAGIFFMLVGMTTQYFDFYTVPILTFCMPALYFLALKLANGEEAPVKEVLRYVICWLFGYAASWIVKLLLSSAFTTMDGIENGFAEFALWMKMGSPTSNSKVFEAYKAVWYTLCPNRECLLAAVLFFAALIVTAVMIVKKHGKDAFGVRSKLGILAVTLLPLIWYAAASAPTQNHAFFQYRSAAAVIWGFCLFACLVPRKAEN